MGCSHGRRDVSHQVGRSVCRLSLSTASKRGPQVGTVNYMVCYLEEGIEQQKLAWSAQRYPATTLETHPEREIQEALAKQPEKGLSEQWRTPEASQSHQGSRGVITVQEEGCGQLI